MMMVLFGCLELIQCNSLCAAHQIFSGFISNRQNIYIEGIQIVCIYHEIEGNIYGFTRFHVGDIVFMSAVIGVEAKCHVICVKHIVLL